MMPWRAPSLCPYPGCGELVPSGVGRCPKHKRKPEEGRPSAAARGYGRDHQKWRRMILRRDPTCRLCAERGVLEGAVVADHIVPLSQGGRSTLDNGQGLCEACHNAKTGRERAARGELGMSP